MKLKYRKWCKPLCILLLLLMVYLSGLLRCIGLAVMNIDGDDDVQRAQTIQRASLVWPQITQKAQSSLIQPQTIKKVHTSLIQPQTIKKVHTSLIQPQTIKKVHTSLIQPQTIKKVHTSLIQPQHYLLPINFALANDPKTRNNKTTIQAALREGIGLEPYVSENGEKGWMENGVVYRPFHKWNNLKPKFETQSPYTPEYEEYIPLDEERFPGGKNIPEEEKKIILWYSKTRYAPPMPDLQPLSVCPEFPCVMTSNRTFVNKSSALLFSAQLLEPTPPPKRPGQVYIFHNHETPYGVHFEKGAIPKWRNVFNWTMSFRMDSDIPALYGVIRKRPEPLRKNYTAILSKKTKLVVWVSSHCNTISKRDEYAKELQKHIPVDIYGSCGTTKCGRREKDDQCVNLVSTEYKFYLSFENAFCKDYITEKLFKYMALDVITVGRGGASDDFGSHVPADIFINAADFSSPKKLAERLKYLDANDEAYVEMLRRKDEYMFVFQDYPIRVSNGRIKYIAFRHEETSFCHICYRLWNLRHFSSSVISDVFEWFNRGNCTPKKDVKMPVV